MTSLARPVWLTLLTFALTGLGCGQQDEIHTNTGPESNSSAATPSTAPITTAEATAPTASPAAPVASTDTPPIPPPATDDPEVTLEKVNYDAFLKRMAANPKKAKYTMVDIWATWCGPCRENFPHVVEMHQKYADKGLAVASLSFDDPTNRKQVDDATAFLREKRATFSNYLLDEPENVGFDKFNFNGIPVVLIYGPDGKEVKRFTGDDPNNQFTYEEVEKIVAEMLDGKSS